MVHIRSFSRRLLPAALMLTLGFGGSSCEKILDVEPQNSLDATAGLKTPADIQAAIRGSYDILQSANYLGLRYQLFADLGADNARHTGTFPSFANIANAAILPDNVELTNMWNTIYAGINRVNYVIQQAERLNDPSFDKNTALAEARALRAFHYMNLLAYWGGTPAGYGYAGGVGVPLRLTPTTSITGEEIKPIARSTEAEVVAAIREDLDFAAQTLPGERSTKAYIGKATVLALRARLELRLRNYEAAADYASQVDATLQGLTPAKSLATNITGASYDAIFSQKFSSESIWELGFDPVDGNTLAFFWFPAASGGRNEVDPATGLGPAHEAGDLRRNVNVVTAATAVPGVFPSGTTRKYYRIASSDDNVILVRSGEVVLTWAEALARTGQLESAATLVNRVRARAGLAALSAETTADQTLLVNAILKERRVELANEGFRWFDLRRTGLVQMTLPLVTQEFRNLWPIPQRELQTSNGLIVQNTGY
ncbi:RagB/SusD family nutrient uptake outer membrane protein [Hymenobacter sp. BT18]|uniref:RagB/SusD family nutrient uptake outer membrane protein n=1 Tax=Hymenobacter sp. BT18 TaxID=2835648 RepID=UPI00143E517B|nr:RagB/SusD family nutrient uptake outer membrane protein [Hymenobacter sp. BT18]QIX62491.1 RagB/SusD family nutrient uptake outer membrane protein [Hymenobacter sp. BT18]